MATRIYQKKGSPPFLLEGMEIQLNLRLGLYDAIIERTSPGHSSYRHVDGGSLHRLWPDDEIVAWNPIKATLVVHL